MSDEDDPARLHAAGRISAEVALARLVLMGADPDDLPARLAAAGRTALATTAISRLDGLRQLRRLLVESGLDHAETSLARIRDTFDRAVAASPQASVAAYALADPGVLAAATAEVVAWLTAERLIGVETDVLDFGCGIGRIAAALAPRTRSVLGLDLSPAMIETARRMNSAANIRYETTSGADLASVPARSSDLVLAVDSFPYVVQAGSALGERHMADFARVLRAGGTLAILNLSYRSPVQDRADAERWAALHGLRLTHSGVQPFRLWDGRAWAWQRDAG